MSVRTNPLGERQGAKKKDKRENKSETRRLMKCSSITVWFMLDYVFLNAPAW